MVSDSEEHRRSTGNGNLRPWKPGESGNPKGRPKGTGLTDRLRKILDGDEGDVAQRLMQAGVDAAQNGDFRFWQEILNRIDGKVADRLAGEDGPLQIIFERMQEEADASTDVDR